MEKMNEIKKEQGVGQSPAGAQGAGREARSGQGLVEEIEIVTEPPAFVLEAYDFNGEGEEVPITWKELRAAKPGDTWVARGGNSWRACVIEECAKVLFKDDEGAIVRVTSLHVGSYPNFEEWEEVEVLYFRFLD